MEQGRLRRRLAGGRRFASSFGATALVAALALDRATKNAAAILFRLNPGVGVAAAEAFLESKRASDPNTASEYGSLVFDVEAVPGRATEAQTRLEAGQYLAVAAPENGPPKLRAAFTVAAAQSPATLPKPAAKIRSIEFDFRGPTTLHRGELVGFENTGFLVHMDTAYPTKSKATAKQLAHDLLVGREQQAGKLLTGSPVTLQGGSPTAPTSRRRSPPSPAGTSRPAS